jgi:cobalt/nickel transport system permease protein
MSSIIVGPFATVILTMISLFFQAFLAHGGITTLGANTVSMGIIGGFSGYLVYIGSRRANAPIWFAAGLAGFIGDILCYVTAALELALSLNPTAVMSHWTLYAMGYIPTQLPLAVMEFIFTAAIVNYITTVRPDLLSKIKSTKGGVSNGR